REVRMPYPHEVRSVKSMCRTCTGRVAVLVFGSMAVASTALAQPKIPDRWLAGRYYRLGTNRTELLGRWEMSCADSVWTSQYVSADDWVALADTLLWRGDRVVAYSYVRPVSGERSHLIRRGNRLEYTMEVRGKRTTASKSADSLFLVGPAVG